VRFQPVVGRYVRLELAGKLADRPWEVAEIELYGRDSPAAMEKRDAFAACGPGRLPVTLDALRMRIHTAGNKTEKGWFLFGQGSLGDFVRFGQACRYRVTITAGIGYEDKEKRVRELVVYVGAQRFGPFPVQPIEMTEQSFTVSVPEGVEEIIIQDCHNNGAYTVVKAVVQPVE
jgi:hypothetical protein